MSRKSRLLSRSLTLALGMAAVQAAAPQQATPPILGFTAASSARQLELESQYDASLDVGNLEEWMRYITSKPVYTGSPHNKETADWMVEQFQSWGFETRLDLYQVLYPTPSPRFGILLAVRLEDGD